jgi:hypothetical protein
VNDPSSQKSQRERFNGQRNRLTSGPSNEREDAVDSILHA